MAYEMAQSFYGCIDEDNKKKPVVYCNECQEITCVRNKIKRQIGQISDQYMVDLVD